MRKINSLRGDALAATMKQSGTKSRTRGGHGDKKDCFPVKSQPKVYSAISCFRLNEGMVFHKHPIGARQPLWSYGPDSATAREEHVAMLVDGPITGAWRSYKPSSAARLDKAKHAKTLARLSREEAAKGKVRREL